MPQNQPPMAGDDIRAAMRMAADDMGGVQEEMGRLGRESRLQILKGDQRRDFFANMTQDEFDIMHDVAMAQGVNGVVALERLMREAADMFRDSKDTVND